MPPLFILAPPRSFTSVMCAMLGEHPQMFGLAEVNLFAGDTIMDMRLLYATRRFRTGLLRSLAQLAFSEQTEQTVEAAKAWLRDNADLTTAEVFRTLQTWADGRVLIDKSPLYVLKPDALNRMKTNFPDARYLHLTRHPTDTIQSLLQLQQRAGWGLFKKQRSNADTPEKFWLNPHRSVAEFLETIPAAQKMRLRGEDSLADPRAYLRKIAEWLGVRSDDAAVEAMMHPENSPFAKLGPQNATYGNDPNFMENPRLHPYKFVPKPFTWEPQPGKVTELSETIRRYAKEFGY